MKDTLRLIELLEGQIESFSETGIYEIERDLLLERLRGVYASVLALDVVTEEDRVIDALLGVGAGVAEDDEAEPEMEVERIYPSDDEPEPIVEDEPATDDESEVEEESAEEELLHPTEEDVVVEVESAEEEIVVEEEVVVEEAVAEEEPIKESASAEIDHQKAMSLYDDDDESNEEEEGEVLYWADDEDDEEEPEQVEEDAVEEEVEVEQEPINEEPAEEEEAVVEEGQYEGFVEPQVVDVATAASASMSLRQSIGINDKFILLRDLFAGDNDYYESSIDKLDEFDNLDEAMLYIYDNFRWSPNSEGARLLMELLARKLF
ncbi:MAG: hypothetical protein J6R10_02905 [Tidjanibacter sp.]|nr:hypothetical protein [Tidjanibacter sp.]